MASNSQSVEMELILLPLMSRLAKKVNLIVEMEISIFSQLFAAK